MKKEMPHVVVSDVLDWGLKRLCRRRLSESRCPPSSSYLVYLASDVRMP